MMTQQTHLQSVEMRPNLGVIGTGSRPQMAVLSNIGAIYYVFLKIAGSTLWHYAVGNGNSEKPLQASDKFLAISLHIKNLAPFEQDFTTHVFTLKDSHSVLPQRMSLSLPVRTDPSSKLAPNDQVEGDIVYEVGGDQTHFTLTYQRSPANSKPTLFTWDVNV